MRVWLALATVATTLVVGVSSASAYPVPGARLGPADARVAAAPFDEQFIDTMAMHHMSAIDMARVALDRAEHPRVRRLAEEIIRSQSAELRTFHRLRARWYGSPTFRQWPMDDFTMRMMGEEPMGPMMHRLEHGHPFDRLFLNAMIAHHSGANTMARWEILAGRHRQLRRIAAEIFNAQSQEIGLMIRLRMRWYGANPL